MKKKQEHPPKFHITLKDFFLAFWKTIVVWVLIGIFIVVALHYNVDKRLIGGSVVIVGIITQAFVGLLNIHLSHPLAVMGLVYHIRWMMSSLGRRLREALDSGSPLYPRAEAPGLCGLFCKAR